MKSNARASLILGARIRNLMIFFIIFEMEEKSGECVGRKN
jgi:hypothetical protein